MVSLLVATLALAPAQTAALPPMLAPLLIGQESRPGGSISFGRAPERVAPQGRAIFNVEVEPPSRGGMRITVEIIAPDDTRDTLQIEPDKDGKFDFTLLAKIESGRYKIIVKGYDGTPLDTRYVEVTPWNSINDQVQTRIGTIRRHTSDIIRAARTIVNQNPEGPKRTELLKKLTEIEAAHNKVVAKQNEFKDLASSMVQLGSENPAAAAPVADTLTELAEWSSDARDEEARLAELSTKLRTKSTICDGLDNTVEALQLVSNVMMFITSPEKILVNLCLEKVLPAADNAPPAGGDTGRFALSQARKQASAFYLDNWNGIIGGLVGTLGDTVTFVSTLYFNDYCTVVEGPIKAEFSVDAKHTNKTYWRYKLVLEGKLKLWSDKNAANEPQGRPFSGRLEGNTTKLEFYEDIFLVEPMPKGSTLLLRRRISPRVISSNSANDPTGAGQVGRAIGVPGYFDIRYLAWMNEERLSFKQDHVIKDFGPTYKNAMVFVAATPGGLLPVMQSFDFPIQKAAWIIDRATKGPFEIPLTREEGKAVAKRTITRDEVTGGGSIDVKWVLTYDLKQK